MIYIEELDIVRRRFTDLSRTLMDLSSNKRALEDETIEALKVGFSSVISVVSSEEFGVVSDVSKTYLSYIKDLQNSIGTQGVQIDRSFSGVMDVFDKSKKVFSDFIEEIKIEELPVPGDDLSEGGKEPEASKKYAPGEAKKKGRGTGLIKKEAMSLKSAIGGWMGKLKVPRFGAIAAGGIMMMAYGYMESDRIRQEAGEVKNILVTAFGGAVDSAVARGTRQLSNLQETLQKFVGISKDEVQGVVSELTRGGVSINEMLSKVDYGLGSVGKNFVTFTLGVDKMFELAGGTSAGRMVELMRNYGKSMEEAKDSLTRMMFAGRESGIGTEQFVKNVMSAAEDLKDFGFDIDTVIGMTTRLQEMYEKIGVPRQFAGREAAMGMKQLASGVSQLSDDWKSIIGEQMGYGTGLEARQKFVEAITRVMDSGSNQELYEISGKMFATAMKFSRGDESSAMFFLEKSLGLGIKGARAVMNIGRSYAQGEALSANKAAATDMKQLRSSFSTEASKTSKFQLTMNKWMKGISNIGQGILGILGNTIAWVIAGFKTLIGAIINYMRGDTVANEKLFAKFEEFDILTKNNTDKIVLGLSQLKDSAKSFGLDAFGQNIAKAFSFKIDGSGPDIRDGKQSSVVQIVTVPVNKVVQGSSYGFSGAPASSSEAESSGLGSDWAGGALSIVLVGVTETGDMNLSLVGNCPRCGLVFGKDGGSGADYSSMSLAGEGNWSGKDVEALARMMQKEMGGYTKSRETEAAGIAHTALNRAKQWHKGKGDSLYKVITGGHGWGKQGKDRAYASGATPTKSTVDFARKILQGTVSDPTKGATHFFHAKQGDKFSAGAVPKFAEKGGITTVIPSRGQYKAYFVKPGTSDTSEGKAGRAGLTQVSTQKSSGFFSGVATQSVGVGG